MLRRTHYVVVSLLMAAVFVLFLLTSTALFYNKDQLNNAYSYADDRERGGMAAVPGENQPRYAIITGVDKKYQPIADSFAMAVKAAGGTAVVAETLFATSLEGVDAIMIATPEIDRIGSVSELRNLAAKGKNLFFGVLPSRKSLEDKDLCELLSITYHSTDVVQKGMDVFPGFLLGGWIRYEKMNVPFTRVRLSSRCKVYAVAAEENPDIENEDKMPLIWRTYWESGMIFVGNAPFLYEKSGMGVVMAMLSELYEDFAYPVINTQSLMVFNFPYLSNENKEKLNELYSRDAQQFLSDILIPNLISLSATTDHIITAYITPSFDQTALDQPLSPDVLPFLRTEMAKLGGELGISGYDRNPLNTPDKLLSSMEIYREALPGYDFTSFAPMNLSDAAYRELLQPDGALSGVRSRIGYWIDPKNGMLFNDFGFFSDTVVDIPVGSSGFLLDEQQNWALRNFATAYGAVIHGVDMSEIVYPQTEEDDWKYKSIEYAKNMDTNLKPFKSFEKRKASGLTRRVMDYLTVRPDITYRKSEIEIRLEADCPETFLILRTEKQPEACENIAVTEVEDNVYLLHVTDGGAVLPLREKTHKIKD